MESFLQTEGDNCEVKMCKVSVIVPVYNAENFLQNTLNNIQRQSLKDIEIICVDDGSEDSSADIIKKFQRQDIRIRYEYQKNQGAGVARNKGISLAQGEYVAFMDADDGYPNIYSLEKLYLAARKNQALICGGSAKGINQSGYNKRVFEKEGFVWFFDYQFDFLFQRFIFKRSFLEDKNIAFPDLKIYEDPIFLSKALVEAEKFFAIMEEVYLYTGSHQISTINLEKTKDYLRGITQSLHLSSIHQLAGLHRETVERLEKEACYYAEKYLYDGDQELLYLLLDANAAINRELIGINDTYVLSAVISMWNAANKYMTLRNVKLIKIIKKLLYIKK